MYKFKALLSISLLLGFGTLHAETKDCNVKLYSRAISYSSTFSGVIKDSNCSTTIQNKTSRALSQIQGKAKKGYLLSLLNEKLKDTVTLENDEIHIYSLEELLKDRGILVNDHYLRDVSSLDRKKSLIPWPKESSLEIRCTSCDKLGKTNIKVTLNNPMSGTKKGEWIKGSIKVRNLVLKAQRNISVTDSSLSPTDFKRVEILTANPEQSFTNLEEISFYKLTRNLLKGEILDKTQLTSIALVKINRPITILYESNQVKLKGRGIPLSTGRYGDTVKFKSVNGDGISIGKVIDFDKVTVEL